MIEAPAKSNLAAVAVAFWRRNALQDGTSLHRLTSNRISRKQGKKYALTILHAPMTGPQFTITKRKYIDEPFGFD